MSRLLEIMVVLVLLLWLVGAFVMPVGGRLIHQLLVFAILLVVVRLVVGINAIRAKAALSPVDTWNQDEKL